MEVTVDHVRVFKALGDPTRLRIVALLAAMGEQCVCTLSEVLGEPEFKISRHLSGLKAAGLVEARREGRWMHYTLLPANGRYAQLLQELLRVGLAGSEPFDADRRACEGHVCPSTTVKPRRSR
jgi:ArsR family transcriptional regulator